MTAHKCLQEAKAKMKELRKVLLQEAMDSQETTRMKTGSDRASSVGKMILKLEDMDKFYKE